MHILAGILSLSQYVTQTHENKIERMMICPCGRAHPWRHGDYARSSDRLNSSEKSLNPIFIQRYYCPGCRKTCSALPECIAPWRWYLWETQQEAIFLMLLGQSAYAVEKQMKPSRYTLARWLAWIMSQFSLIKDTLCVHFPDLGIFTKPFDFWQALFKKISLATAMRLCHLSGVSVP